MSNSASPRVALASAPTKLEILVALVQAHAITLSQPIPAEGTYVLAEERVSHGCCSGSHLAKHYADVTHSSCGGPYLDVVFRPHGHPVRRRSVRVAVDGSWRDSATLMPVNVYGGVSG